MSINKKKFGRVIIIILMVLIVKTLAGLKLYQNRNLLISAVAHVLVCNGYSEPIKVQFYPEVYITDIDYTTTNFSQDYGYMIDSSKTMGYKEFATKSGKEYSILLIPHNNINVILIENI